VIGDRDPLWFKSAVFYEVLVAGSRTATTTASAIFRG